MRIQKPGSRLEQRAAARRDKNAASVPAVVSARRSGLSHARVQPEMAGHQALTLSSWSAMPRVLVSSAPGLNGLREHTFDPLSFSCKLAEHNSKVATRPSATPKFASTGIALLSKAGSRRGAPNLRICPSDG
jgi:hypothetical protein